MGRKMKCKLLEIVEGSRGLLQHWGVSYDFTHLEPSNSILDDIGALSQQEQDGARSRLFVDVVDLIFMIKQNKDSQYLDLGCIP